MFVLCARHVEDGQHGRRHDEERRGDKVASWTDPPAGAERQRDHGIVAEGGPVLVEETFGLECLWVGIQLRVVQDGPVFGAFSSEFGFLDGRDIDP